MHIKLKFEKGSRNRNKSKQTTNQLEPVTRNISCIGHCYTVTQNQMHAQIKHTLTHLQDLIPTSAGVFSIYILYQPK